MTPPTRRWATDEVAALTAAGTSTQLIDLTTPSTAGTYFYGACVDSVTGETDTANNCSASVQVTVSEPTAGTGPDLSMGPAAVSNNAPVIGENFDLSTTVTNLGDGESVETTLRYYRSTDPIITTADDLVGSMPVTTARRGWKPQ